MSVLDSDKPFDELTDAEIAELEAIDWTAEQIMAALSMALRDGAMEAAVDLTARLARKDPAKAALIVGLIQEMAR